MCDCKYCCKLRRFREVINRTASAEDRAFLESIMNELVHLEDDLAIAEAKLDGTLPGWEKNRPLIPENS